MPTKNTNIVQGKSYAFAIRVVKLYRHLTEEKREYVLSKQLLRSGTSIGANIEESIGGHTRKDFASKVSISYKEARESHFWLRLLRDTEYLNQTEAKSMIEDCEELVKILASIVKTMRANP